MRPEHPDYHKNRVTLGLVPRVHLSTRTIKWAEAWIIGTSPMMTQTNTAQIQDR